MSQPRKKREEQVSSEQIEKLLEAAWTELAPGRISGPFPRGFWPDVARVALYRAFKLELNFRPTVCTRGSAPVTRRAKRKIDLSSLEI